MVDALHSIWLTLARPGTLVDLRPVSAPCPIEVITRHGSVQIGEVDASGMAADDAAADRAIREAVARGWFTMQHTEQFGFAFWWDTVSEMIAFFDGSRRAKAVSPSYAELTAAHRRVSTEAPDPVRLRCARRTMLSSYTKT